MPPAGGRKEEKCGKKKRRRGYRDLVRKAAIGINFAVIGIEKQEEVHYLMPLRAMEYDVAEYERQAAAIRKDVRRPGTEKVSDAEFLSGFRKGSRLYPCIMLVLYFGEGWDGSLDLHGIIDFTDIPEKLKRLVNNYRFHLLDVRKLENTDVFRTDLKQVFDFIRYSGNKKKLSELVQGDISYKELDEDAYDMIVAYASAKELISVKKVSRKKGRVNMCQALEELIEDGKKEGKNRINSLNLKLTQDGRMDDLIKSFQDMDFQERLLEEYNL